ncbi:hypothetical protein BDZ89DRAFT_1135412 [Hymenopellis radicata]|nr:hypothetical protein BDZ89DRAFT_1135412 [Hymenopellis radicata]
MPLSTRFALFEPPPPDWDRSKRFKTVIGVLRVGELFSRYKSALKQEKNWEHRAIVGRVDANEFDKLLTVSSHFNAKRSTEDPPYHSAQQLTAATFGNELAQSTGPFGHKLKRALRSIGKDPQSDVFDEEMAKIDRHAEEIGTIQNLRHSKFNPILNVLIRKYMLNSFEVASGYFPKIADRIADPVRKRVIKLLKAYYAVTRDAAQQVEIGTHLVLRMLDENESVKDLASKTIEELWFPSSA